MAIQLAKKRWPNVIANEIHHDGGEDGTSIFAGVIGERSSAIGCSITGTLSKVKDDCNKIKQRQRNIDFFVFCTPKKISVHTIDDWKKEVNNEYEHDLIVIGREDIAESLLDPEVSWLVHQYLHIPHDENENQTLENVRTKIRSATSSELDKWKHNYLITSGPEINLAITYDNDAGRSFSIAELPRELLLHRRLVIKGLPGAGKTYSLIRLAEQLLNQPSVNHPIPIICSFAEWAAKNVSLTTYISSRTSMQANNVTEADIAKLSEAGELVFLLNGWNEVPQNDPYPLIQASLNELTRCSFIITSREGRLDSIKNNFVIASLERIRFAERKRYLTAAGVHDSATVLSRLTIDRGLNEITRIPLFLTMLVDLIKDGVDMPKNKYEIIKTIIRKIEDMTEHQHYLTSPPMEGNQAEFLQGLSAMMMQHGIASVKPENAIQLITQLDTELSSRGRKAPAIAHHILDTLSDHHILVLSDGYQFLHQQFQEWYTADYLDHYYIEHAQSNDRWTEFKNKIINLPEWQESLLFLADKLFLEQRHEEMAGLINAIIPIDPVFAANVVAKTSDQSWEIVKDRLGPLLRTWYDSPEKYNRECALAGMTATGKPDFADIFLPLIRSGDYQVRVGIYHNSDTFELSLLGNDWRDIVTELPDEQKSELILRLIYSGNSDIIRYVHEQSDSLPVEMRLKVYEALSFRGVVDENKFTFSVSSLLTCTGTTIVNSIRKVPRALVEDCIDEIYRLFTKLENLKQKQSFIAFLGGLNNSHHCALIETELNEQITGRDGDAEYIAFLINELIQHQPVRASLWIKKVFLSGRRVTPDWASHIVDELSISDIEQLVDFATKNTNRSYESRLRLGFLAGTNHPKVADSLISYAIVLTQNVKADPQYQNKDLHDSYYNLCREIQCISYALRAEIILSNYSEISDTDSISTLISLLLPPFRVFGHDDDNIDIALPVLVRKELIALLTKWYGIIEPEENIGPTMLSHCFTILTAIITSDDNISIVADWLEREIHRYHNSWDKLEAWVRSDRESERPNITDYFNLYIGALERAQGFDPEPLLKRLLLEPTENGGATRALVNIHRPLKKEPFMISKEKEYEMYYNALNYSNSRPMSSETNKTRELVQHISQTIATHLNNLGDTNQRHSIISSQVEAASMLAYLDVELASSFILRLVEQDTVEWEMRRAFSAMLKNGRRLESDKVLDYIDKRFNAIQHDHWKRNDQHYISLLFDYVGILLFSDKPSLAFPYIDKLFELDRYSNNFTDLLYALAYSADEEVSAFLFSLKDHEVIKKRRFKETWLRAVLSEPDGNLNVEIRQILANPDQFIERANTYDITESLASKAVAMAKQDQEVWEDIKLQCNSPLSQSQLSLLCKILYRINTDESAMVACELLHSEFVSQEVDILFEDLFTHQVPIEDQPNVYHVFPHELNEARKKLFEMSINNDPAGLLASNILARFRIDRIQQGWAYGETRHPNIETEKPWPYLH